jgi:hypothetical protein
MVTAVRRVLQGAAGPVVLQKAAAALIAEAVNKWVYE